jgi:hypothetical protein
MEQENKTQILTKKAELFLKENTLVCLLFLNDRFKHGLIKQIKDEFFIFEDRFEGSLPVFFIELRDIEPSRQKVEK